MVFAWWGHVDHETRGQPCGVGFLLLLCELGAQSHVTSLAQWQAGQHLYMLNHLVSPSYTLFFFSPHSHTFYEWLKIIHLIFIASLSYENYSCYFDFQETEITEDKITKKRGWGFSSVVKPLPSKPKALSSVLGSEGKVNKITKAEINRLQLFAKFHKWVIWQKKKSDTN